MLALGSSAMKEAFEEINRLSQDPQTYWLAISKEIHLREQIQRETKVRIKERNREIVLKLYRLHIPLEMIAKATKLSIEKVWNIIKSNEGQNKSFYEKSRR